ncbi:hypothetical protein F5148DRAFT_1245490 [Russula earlei]|uniref:Uncharacterized protein n=1 Tax=Russula earlei TaxID=71964 RepID=A0ACC0TUK5_9AGAM|nr:hypothetical protein F5148DRAFT_1245490 [Russula earlei]
MQLWNPHINDEIMTEMMHSLATRGEVAHPSINKVNARSHNSLQSFHCILDGTGYRQSFYTFLVHISTTSITFTSILNTYSYSMRTSSVFAIFCLAIGIAPSFAATYADLFEFSLSPENNFIMHRGYPPGSKQLGSVEEWSPFDRKRLDSAVIALNTPLPNLKQDVEGHENDPRHHLRLVEQLNNYHESSTPNIEVVRAVHRKNPGWVGETILKEHEGARRDVRKKMNELKNV